MYIKNEIVLFYSYLQRKGFFYFAFPRLVHLHTIYTFSQKEMYLYSISTFDNPRSTTPNIQYYKKANIVESAEMASIFQ